MTFKVVDASAVAAICFAEAEATLIASRFTGATLLSTALLDFELANICWKRSRRHPNEAQHFRLQLLTRDAFQIDIREVAFDAVVDLAYATGLTAYDASYLWLARHVKAELVTLDKRLERVALATA